MDKKHKRYLKLNLMSLFFAGVSFISITLAWFAYSGLATVETVINVKAWQIEFKKGENKQNSLINVTLNDVYPGMQVKNEIININNLGDDDATLDYEIKSARIFDDTVTASSQQELEDILSHNYPFKINMSLSDRHANAHDGTGEFNVSVSWPLDSGDDKSDSDWGKKAYDFNKSEQDKHSADNTYQIRPSISIAISLKAEQYLSNAEAADPEFKLGTIVLYDYKNNVKCTEISTQCIKSYVIDTNNKIGDTQVTLLPDLYNTYYEPVAYTSYNTALTEVTRGWQVTFEGLKVEHILPIISRDIVNSEMMRPPKSSEVIGNLNYSTRLNDYIASAISQNGYYRFLNEQFPYLTTTKCYWVDTTYSSTQQFALTKVDEEFSKVYNEDKTTTCSVIPVAKVNKIKLKVQ